MAELCFPLSPSVATPPSLRLQAAVRSAVLAHAPQRTHLLALLLTGSLARGEGSWLVHANADRLLGDADLLLVLSAQARLPSAAELAALEFRVRQDLSLARLDASVSLRAVHPSYLETLPPHLFGYELGRAGCVLWGDPAMLRRIPAMDGGHLPCEDAFRLLANRILELLPSACAQGGAAPATPEQVYPWVKLYLDMATSYLVFCGDCPPSYAARAERLWRHAERAGAGDWVTPAFARRVAACTRWKLCPVGAVPGLPSPSGGWAAAIGEAESLWRWELSRLQAPARARLPRDPSRAQLWRAWLGLQPWRSRLRGWGSALRHLGWRTARYWPRWAWMARRASPRYCIYETASELFFRLPHLNAAGWPPAELAAYAARLPLPPPPGALSCALLLRQLEDNYHRLAHSTRA